MGELLATLPAEQLDTIWTAADTWARGVKAAGDERSLDEVRVAALVRWAESFLIHGDSTICDRGLCEQVGSAGAPTRHGRPVTVNVTASIETVLGTSKQPGVLQPSGASIPASVIRDLIAGGQARLRLLIYDPDTGQLIHNGETTSGNHDPTEAQRYRPSPRLARFIADRDVTARTTTGSLADAAGQDLDHLVNHDGSNTTADNLHPPTRRWHRAKTLGHWTTTANPDGNITWTSRRTGRSYTTTPYDYRDD